MSALTEKRPNLSPLQEHYTGIAQNIAKILSQAPKGAGGEIFIPDIYKTTSEQKPTKTRYLEKIRHNIWLDLQATGLDKKEAYKAIGMEQEPSEPSTPVNPQV